ncbi:MAG: BRO-N domain-containing protein [Vicingaceae bacterium]
MPNIKLFQDKKIRTTFNEIDQKWYFAIIDVVQILTESSNARRYWSDLKRKLVKEGYNELYENIVQLKLEAPDGKLRETDCANTEGLLRIIQSVPSPKAEPFKNNWKEKLTLSSMIYTL